MRRYLPELRSIAGGRVHEPWKLASRERRMLDYPAPIVSHQEAADEFSSRRAAGRSGRRTQDKLFA